MVEKLAAVDVARVRSNLERVRQRIDAACARAGRDATGVELVAATKYVDAGMLGALADAGIELVGENIAQDLERKHELWSKRLVFDFIGHLQSRKARLVLPLVRLIHSVESESVLRAIERHATGDTPVLLEVNLAREHSKYGVAPEAVDRLVETAGAYPKVRFTGLMTMPPATADPQAARPYFRALRELGERLATQWAPRHDFRALSMGTSQDFEVAVEEGATIVRLGGVLYA